jgi:CheY-like chemotaxis protein
MSNRPLVLLVEDNPTTQETLKRDFEALPVRGTPITI